MPYTTKESLEKASSKVFVAQTSNDGDDPAYPIGTANDLVVAEVIQTGTTIIDSKLRGRYTVPVATIEGGDAELNLKITEALKLLENINNSISLYELHTKRFPDKISEGRQTKYDQAMAMLDSIQAGKTVLFVVPTQTVEQVMVFRSHTKRKMFDSDTLDRM